MARLKKQVCRTVPTHLFFIVFVALTCYVAVTRCASARRVRGERSVGYAETFLDGGNLLCGLGVATGVAACTLHCALYLNIELDLGLCA